MVDRSEVAPPRRWGREAEAGTAVGRILDAAQTAFVARGVAATTMADVARAAGCSRATLYRYFPDRASLRRAYVDREALKVAATVAGRLAGVSDPGERVVEGIVASVDLVRSTPTLAAWFTSTDMGVAAELSASSEVVGALASGLLGDPDDVDAARWLVRIIVSLLTTPGQDAAEERHLLDRFVRPLLRIPS